MPNAFFIVSTSMNLTFIMSETRCFVNARRASSTLYPCLANSQTGHAIMVNSRGGFVFVCFKTSLVCRSVQGRGDAAGAAWPIYMPRRAAGVFSVARRGPEHRCGISAVRANTCWAPYRLPQSALRVLFAAFFGAVPVAGARPVPCRSSDGKSVLTRSGSERPLRRPGAGYFRHAAAPHLVG